MNQTLRKWLHWTMAVVLAVVLVLIVIPVALHPNQYRAPLAALFKGITGRQVTIAGEVGMALFPNVELILRDVTLAGDPEVGPDPLARVRTLVVGVKFIPLLSGRIELDRAEMRGLQLHLTRLPDGTTSLDRLLASPMADGERKEGLSPLERALQRFLALSVAGVELTETTLFWWDRSTDRKWRVELLDFKTGPVHPGRPVSVTGSGRLVDPGRSFSGQLELKGQLRAVPPARLWLEGVEVSVVGGVAGEQFQEIKGRLGGDLAVDGAQRRAEWSRLELAGQFWTGGTGLREVQVGWQGRMSGDLSGGRWLAPQGQLTVISKGDALPPAGVQARLLADVMVDTRDPALHLDKLLIEGPAGVRVKGSVRTRERLSVIEGGLVVDRFDFRALLIALGRTIPANPDVRICSGAEAELDFVWRGTEIAVPRMALGLDATHWSGTMGWDYGQPALRFDWEIDQLDLDRFRLLVPERWSGWSALEQLSPDLTMQGRLQVGNLQRGAARWSDVALVMEAQERVLRLDPLSWSMHGGSMAARLVLDRRGAGPAWSLDHVATNVHVGPLLQEWVGWNGLDGVGEWSGHVEARGSYGEALLSTVQGQVEGRLVDGVFSGVDVAGRIRQAHAQHQRLRSVPAAGEETRLSRLSASALIRDGVLLNADLEANGSGVRLFGAGQVDMVKRRVEYQWQADVVAALQGGMVDVERYQGVTLPLSWRGAFDALKKIEVGTPAWSEERTFQ
ncbi:MAG: AsmA family protein [Magnetococcales bacterium]|nr:AsmA family protein [Magnetococcales bacterium]NGZ05894.1 AsmA family protein [Magnetococcales bacterium]